MHADIMPDWLEAGTEKSLRDSEDETPLVSANALMYRTTLSSEAQAASPAVLTPFDSGSPHEQNGPQNTGFTDLDKFYAEDTDSDQELEAQSEENQSNSSGEEAEESEEEQSLASE